VKAMTPWHWLHLVLLAALVPLLRWPFAQFDSIRRWQCCDA